MRNEKEGPERSDQRPGEQPPFPAEREDDRRADQPDNRGAEAKARNAPQAPHQTRQEHQPCQKENDDPPFVGCAARSDAHCVGENHDDHQKEGGQCRKQEGDIDENEIHETLLSGYAPAKDEAEAFRKILHRFR